MAATKPEINKSQSIRDYFKKNPKAHAKEVVTALAGNGITVTESHVYVVKGKLKMKKAAKAKEKAAAAPAKETAKKVKTPPSAEAPNKSQAIRDLFKQNPAASLDEVISTLAADGIQVTKSLVYLVKGKMKVKKKGRRRNAKKMVAKVMVTAPSSNGSPGDALKTIMQVKGLANELGGLKKLKALVDALSE
jgi:arginine repressor